jgi:uncharacterized protein YbjT (DUF2867 family)
VHVEAAQRAAAQARRAGAERLVHVSGIGADATARSRYIRKRGEGERMVRSVNRRSNLTPYRRPILTPLSGGF